MQILPTFADMIWPAVFVVQRLFAWWVIGAGLFVELFFVRYVTKLGWKMCVVADISMNIASSTLGTILILVAGFAWDIAPAHLLYPLFNAGTFSPLGWTINFIISFMINGVLESLVLRYGFKQRIGKKGFWIICLANAVSVGIAYLSFLAHPPTE